MMSFKTFIAFILICAGSAGAFVGYHYFNKPSEVKVASDVWTAQSTCIRHVLASSNTDNELSLACLSFKSTAEFADHRHQILAGNVRIDDNGRVTYWD